MKTTIISACLFSSILLISGCGTSNQTIQSDYSAYSGSTPIIAENTSPTCVPENLATGEILGMDALVKNCSSQEKEGKVLDGLGGVCPEYQLYNTKLVQQNYADASEGIICKDGETSFTVVPINDATREGLGSFSAIEKIAGRGLLDTVFASCYPDNIYCQDNDSDCSTMKDFGGRAEGDHYFVAGQRSDAQTASVLYVINGKLYNPGENQMGRGFIQESKRNFAGIKDNKILVKRIKGAQIKGNPNLDDPKLDLNTLKTRFILETCEIDI